MGLDVPALMFLTAAQRRGVDFTDTATIGRQSLRLAPHVLADVFRRLNIDRDAAEFLREAGGYGEPYFRLLGARQVTSLDASGYEGATHVHDMNTPIGEGLKDRFSAVYDGGTLEHVFNYPQAIRNCMEMVRVGGHFLQVTNANNYMGHGFYQYSPELIYGIFSAENGYAVEAVLLHEFGGGNWWYRVSDPKEVGKRVELCNRRPTYMLTLARRISLAPVFARYPQQSDYVAIWQDPGRRPGPAANGHRPTPFRRLRRLVPEGVRRVVRDALERRSPEFGPDCYRRIDGRDFVRGDMG